MVFPKGNYFGVIIVVDRHFLVDILSSLFIALNSGDTTRYYIFSKITYYTIFLKFHLLLIIILMISEIYFLIPSYFLMIYRGCSILNRSRSFDIYVT